MYLRPLFWMITGAGATLVAGAWGGREPSLISSDSERTVLAKAAVLMETSFKTNSAYAAENALSRTPWVKPKADPFGEKPVVVRPKVVTVVEKREPPPLVFPFEYIGKLTADGKETMYLSKGEQIYPIAEGETLDNLYRVEHTSSDSIELSYLPDARKMTISLESITAKQNSGAANRPSNSVTGSIEPSPAASYGGVGIPPQIDLPMPHDGDVPPTKAPSESEVLQQMTASAPPVSFSADGSLQSAAISDQQSQPPAPVPPVPMPPGMLPPGMMPPGAPQ